MTIVQQRAAACPDTRWTKLPDALLSVLTPREHQLVHALLSYRWTPDAPIYPSVRTLARRLGCSERTIQRTARQLAGKGYLIIDARYRDDQGQTSNLYRPGPLLVALLPPASASTVSRSQHDHHPPVTRPADERDSGKNTTPTGGRQGGYTPANTRPEQFLNGALGAWIHT